MTLRRRAPAFATAGVGAALLAVSGAAAAAPRAVDRPDVRTGGDTTVWVDGRNAFSFPLATLSDDERARFSVGNSFFRRNWVEAPASTQARDGLGPHFIARSCGGCHVQDGRGAPPVVRHGRHEQPVALLMRLSVPGTPDPRLGVLPEPTYGEQFSNRAIPGVRPEGRVTIRLQPVRGRFADATPYTLHRPVYGFADLGYGPMRPDTMVGPRIAPQLAGVGLLESIPEAAILANAAAQAAGGGPAKGKPNRVWDAFAGAWRVGRFGWKANVASLAHQTAGAFHGDIGITSSRHPAQACTAAQQECRAAPAGGQDGGPEIDDRTLGDVVFYQATLAAAARRRADDPKVRRGETLFHRAQCHACHRPSWDTGEALLPTMSSSKLAGQRIWPYTDLLLHDMGDDLADGRPDFAANGRQWRTPPLWGIGLIRGVNGHQRLLHDGRADGVLEAILWHGGEAEPSRRAVLRYRREDRDALVRFVESL